MSLLARRKFVFFTLDDFFLYHFRLPLMQALQKEGVQVFAVAPPGEFAERFSDHHIEFVPLPIDRRTFNPLKSWKTVRELRRILKVIRPHLLHSFAHRPNGYAGLALWGVYPSPRFVATVTGLGSLYVRNDPVTRLRRWMTETTLRLAFRKAQAVIFQNSDDRREFLKKGLCRPTQSHLIPGSGVDVTWFHPHLFSPEDRRQFRARWGLHPQQEVVLMVSRLIRDKGVLEFLAAAQRLRGKAQFVLVGGPDPGNPQPLFWEEIQSRAQRAGVWLPGFQEDVRSWYAIADVFVLPSYREGLPKTLLEAMAMALPVVATKVPGCRDVVVNGETGLLIPPRDIDSLVEAIQYLLENKSLRQRLGWQARQRVEKEFEMHRIVDLHLQLYQRLLWGSRQYNRVS